MTPYIFASDVIHKYEQKFGLPRRWPSLEHKTRGSNGSHLLKAISLQSLYGAAFQYADKVFHGGAYTGSEEMTSGPESIGMYFNAVWEGAAPMVFVLYVPPGYASLEAIKIPNVEETENPGKDLHRPL